MVTTRYNPRFIIFLVVSAAVLLVLFFNGSSIHAHSKQYVSGLLKPSVSEQVPSDISHLEDSISSPSSSEPASHLLPEPLPESIPVDATSESLPEAPSATHADSTTTSDESGYNPDKWFFQGDIDYPLPQFDIAKLRKYPPHNYKGPGNDAYAAFYTSRNASMQEPYFLATLEIIYRLLWAPDTKSQHPVVVFVASHISDAQRGIFQAMGAIVREVEKRPFAPNADTTSLVAERLRDVFAKLEMWTQTDFSRLVYLDSDAFPLINIDLLLTDVVVPTQKCNQTLVSQRDMENASGACNYVMGATHEMTGMLNAGVMVLKPSRDMYSILMREYHDGSNFDNGFVEQALLSYVFRQDGPFPPTVLNEEWNGSPIVRDQGKSLFILHAKIWSSVMWYYSEPGYWAAPIWDNTWKSLSQLLGSSEFEKMRAQDAGGPFPP